MEKKYLAIICGDWNDGDYVYNIETVNEQEKDWLIHIDKLIDETILNSKSSRWRKVSLEEIEETLYLLVEREFQDDTYSWIPKTLTYAEKCRAKENSMFNYLSTLSIEDLGSMLEFILEWIPGGYECSCHTLCSLDIYEITNKIY